jgi:spore coat polysaccharide biosynthesis predicted glycosyltransferase SpsG
MKIAIITDGNNQLGMGHVYQSITLAGLLLKEENKHVEISFLTKSDKNVADLIKSAGFPITHCADDDELFTTLKITNPERIIFDKLDVSPILAQKIKQELGTKLILFTNLTEANQFADVTVMAGMGSDFKNIHSKDKITGQVQFWGPKYWLLRPDFFYYKTKRKQLPEQIKNIMLIFGGADPANFSTAVLSELLKMNASFRIKLILGAAFIHRQDLDKMLAANQSSQSNVAVVENLLAVAATMFDSDVVFVSPGLSFFEALVVGTPVVCFHQNEFQQDAWKGHIPTLDKTEVHKIPAIITNQSFIFPNDPSIVAMEIALGMKDIVDEIFS